jgi:hypothetical protein
MRTFPRVAGFNFDARDYEQAQARGRERSFQAHLGFERSEVAPSPQAVALAGGYAPTERSYERTTLTPRDLTLDELVALSAQLDAQVRVADAKAVALADDEKSDFERRKAENIAALEKVLEAISSEDERLGLGLRVARIDVRQKLDVQRASTFDRGEVLRPHLPTDSLKLAATEVRRELKNRRAAQAAEQSKVQEMLRQAGISF